MFAADYNVISSDSSQRLLGDEDMSSTPPYSGECSANVLQYWDDLEYLNWESAPALIWASPEQVPLEPSQHLPWVTMEELQCPLMSETVPIEFPTVDLAEESHDTVGEHESRQEDQSEESLEWGGECSDDHIHEDSSPPVLPSGEKIGVTFQGVQIFLGNFETEEEAKMAHDRAAIEVGMQSNAKGKPYQLNFPTAVHASYVEEHAAWTTRGFLLKMRRTSNKFSKGKNRWKGVTMKTRRQSVKRGREWMID